MNFLSMKHAKALESNQGMKFNTTKIHFYYKLDSKTRKSFGSKNMTFN